VGGRGAVRRTHTYPLHLTDPLARTGPTDEGLHVGFVRLMDLHAMFLDMGQRFFDRNIRASLPPESSVNRSLERAFKRIILDETESPHVFAFNHNGVTLSAEALSHTNTGWRITEPRLLNGAQSVTTFARFLKANEGNPRFSERKETVDSLGVLCRIVTGGSPEFITSVTVNNNRQNWVKPWNLRANDMIQLELQEKFRDDVNLYYERQEKAFENLSDEELEDAGVLPGKKIELYKLGQTFHPQGLDRGQAVRHESRRGNFNFLRTNAAYKRAMEFAYKRFKWVVRGLK
jgi:AIPR protein